MWGVFSAPDPTELIKLTRALSGDVFIRARSAFVGSGAEINEDY